ncbi:hypothetical protein [uncultured Lacinutrix sp.]|uniref:hypothetical protein n=1 Tax=uncultured Lacinutrix sp. TaxID=574032 RepID=UPI002603AD8E|nr:hypothetical protein [uncultured Lacinutrix sp.]
MRFQRVLIFIASILFVFNSCKSDDDTITPTNNSVTGILDFARVYGGSKNESAQAVVSTLDGGYAVLGYTQSTNGDITDKTDESFDYWLLKFDTDSELQWNKTYGGSEDDRGKDIIQTQDGGYAILGSSYSSNEDVSTNAGQEDYWLAKLDASGNISWQKSFGYSGTDSGISVIQTNDNGYLISGVLDVTASGGEGNTSRNSSRHAGGDYWIIKLNTDGDIEWSKFFGGLFTDTPEGIVETDDNAFIIAGGSDSADTDISNNKGSYDFWVIKISNTGSLIWEKSFGGSEIDEARGIVKSGDGNYIIAGDTRSSDTDISNNNGAADLWLIKISPLGELLWEKTIGGSSFDVARAIVKTQDNGFLLSGSSRSSDGDLTINQGQNDAWVLKVDSNGILEWQKTVGGSNIDFAYGITELNDKTVVAVGDATSNDGDLIENKGFSDLLIIKIK